MNKDVDEKRKVTQRPADGKKSITVSTTGPGERPAVKKIKRRTIKTAKPKISLDNPNWTRDDTLSGLIADQLLAQQMACPSEDSDFEAHLEEYFTTMGAQERALGLDSTKSIFIYLQNNEFEYQLIRTQLDRPFSTTIELEVEGDLLIPYDLTHVLSKDRGVVKTSLEEFRHAAFSDKKDLQARRIAVKQLKMKEMPKDMPQAIVTHIGAVYLSPSQKLELGAGIFYEPEERRVIDLDDMIKLQSDLREYDNRIKAELTKLGVKKGAMGLKLGDSVLVYLHEDGRKYQLVNTKLENPYTIALSLDTDEGKTTLYHLTHIHNPTISEERVANYVNSFFNKLRQQLKIIVRAAKPVTLEEKLEDLPDLIVTPLGTVYTPKKHKLEPATMRQIVQEIRGQDFYSDHTAKKES